MPEGDTVWHTATILRDALAGKTLTRCDVRVPKFATVDFTGQVVDEVISRGKHLFIRVGPGSIHSHLKMEGSWKVNAVGKPSRAGYRIRIILEAADIQAAGIDLGVLEVLERAHDMDVVAHLGPDLLGDDWDPHIAAANLTAEPDRPLSQALLDQRVLAGVGNVYCNELCFITGYLPSAEVSDVKDPLRMVQRVRDMLWLNRSRWHRPTTSDTRRGRELWVYGRAGLPCRRCGTQIRSSAADARSSEGTSGVRVSYWCPVCQT
jgi:endonuclease VIII